jgi:hypothetical protein
MLAHAFSSVMTAAAAPPTTNDNDDNDNAPTDQLWLVPLTRNEVRRLFATTITIVRTLQHRLHWSQRRRDHQAVARACHYRRRTEQPA